MRPENVGFHPVGSEMFIALNDQPNLWRRSEGRGTQLGRYSSRIIPPLRPARGFYVVRVYKHLTPIGVKILGTRNPNLGTYSCPTLQPSRIT
jgi:hypothetical protein